MAVSYTSVLYFSLIYLYLRALNRHRSLHHNCYARVTSKSKIASNNSDCRPTITGNDHVCINLQCQASEFYQEWKLQDKAINFT